jgi:hypothetical protein
LNTYRLATGAAHIPKDDTDTGDDGGASDGWRDLAVAVAAHRARKPMRLACSMILCHNPRYPTVADLLAKKRPEVPPTFLPYIAAQKHTVTLEQTTLFATA